MTKLQVFALHHPVNVRLNKILVAARFAGVEIEAPAFELGKDNETEDYFNNCSPLGRTPTLQTPEGYLFESCAILRYLARVDKTNSFLYGRTNFEASQVDMWLDFASTEIDPHAMYFLRTHLFGAPKTDAEEEKHGAGAIEVVGGLDRWLENRTFLVGERITVADIGLAFSLDWLLRFATHGEGLKKYKHALRHYHTVMNQPKTLDVLREVGAEIGLTVRKVEKPAAPAPAKKEDKPKEDAHAAHGHDDDGEDEPVQEKKKPNPLDALPPSPFVLDDFKREYSNKDIKKDVMPWFLSKFDPAGWTVWTAKYKYNSDLKMQFMSANLVRGWFQRMEGCRKYAFGVSVIVGTDSKHEILSLWIIRGGATLPECVREVEDTELFEWTPIADIKKEEAKILDYFLWEGPSLGPVLEGRAFK